MEGKRKKEEEKRREGGQKQKERHTDKKVKLTDLTGWAYLVSGYNH